MGTAFIFAACSNSGGEDEAELGGIRTALPPNISPESLLAEADDEQIGLFRDGIIDYADYERASFRLMQCLEAGGAEIITWPYYDELFNEFRWGFSRPDDPQFFDSIEYPCIQKHHMYVQMAWQWQHRPDEQARQSAQQALGACLTDAGQLPAADVLTDDDLSRLLENPASADDAARCLSEIVAEVGFHPFD